MKSDRVEPFHDSFLDGNEIITAAIDKYYADFSRESLTSVLDAIRQRMHADGHFIFPVLADDEDETRFAFRTIQTKFYDTPFSAPGKRKSTAEAMLCLYYQFFP